jgi:hypothetical protein
LSKRDTIFAPAETVTIAWHVGCYADAFGYAVLLLKIIEDFLPVGDAGNFVTRDLVTTVLRYEAVAGMSLGNTEMNFSSIMAALEVMVGHAATSEAPVKIFCNNLSTLTLLIGKADLGAQLTAVDFDPSEMVMVINCLTNEKLLRFSGAGEISLQSQYTKDLSNYKDIKEVNHRLYALALALTGFVPGNADWLLGLNQIKNIETN